MKIINENELWYATYAADGSAPLTMTRGGGRWFGYSEGIRPGTMRPNVEAS